MKYIDYIHTLKMLGRKSVIFCKNTRGNIVLSKPSSILVIKVEVYGSGEECGRRNTSQEGEGERDPSRCSNEGIS